MADSVEDTKLEQSMQQAVQSVEAYITQYNLDDRAANGLRALPEIQQTDVIQQPMNNVRNPSAVVWTRVRVAQMAIKENLWKQQQQEVIKKTEAYITKYELDEKVRNALLALAPQIQEQIVDMPMRDVRNASAVVWTRVRKCTPESGSQPIMMRDKRQRADIPPQVFRPVRPRHNGYNGYEQSWQQPFLQHQQFYSPMPQHLPVHPHASQFNPYLASAPVTAAASVPRSRSLESFILQYSLDERCANALRELPPEKSRLVMSKPMEGVRNPSAVVWTRVMQQSR
jgi:hypothetical protein